MGNYNTPTKPLRKLSVLKFSPVETVMNSSASYINIPFGSFPASTIHAWVKLPLFPGISKRTNPRQFHPQTLLSGDAKFTSSITINGKRHWTHASTHILMPVHLTYIFPLSLKVQMYYSWDITIPPKLLSTLTLRPVVSREFFIVTLMKMI